jgi:hypothetical protein
MKKFRINTTVASTIVIALLALAIPKAEALMGRGVYVNGQVHYLSVGTDSKHQKISHQAGGVDSNMNWKPSGTTVSQSLGACNPDPTMASTMNGAVFDNKIFFAFTANPGCKSTGTHLYVAAYDLTKNTFPNPVKDLGAVHHSNKYDNGAVDVASAAIVVFNNLLYVISDSGTFTSGDGVSWKSYPMLPNNNVNEEPLDAITYYPPDADPRIMIIYGNYTTGAWNYNQIKGANWNGKFDGTSDFRSEAIGAMMNGIGGLLAGTAHNTGLAGAKTPCLQLFLSQAVRSGIMPPENYFYKFEYSYDASGGNWSSSTI